MDNKTIFMVVLYVVLLIMMFTYAGILIQKGEADNKNLYYAFFGFSIVISFLCILALTKSDSKSKMVKYGMGISTLLMFGLLIVAVILSKPQADKTFEIISYINIALVFIANMYAAAVVISPPTSQPIYESGASA
jgi:membrane protease YdiL (CAAX protease family)